MTVARDKSFDPIAELYDEMRPGYPEAVFERIVAFAGIDSSARLLEVGAGTGKATRAMAERGFSILALEPGANMARVARTQLAAFAGAQVQETSLEAWPAPAAAFDLAFVAQAFHWLPPAERLPKLAGALRRPGALAIFGNFTPAASGDLEEAVQAAYRRHAPALSVRDEARAFYGSATGPVFRELAASPRFTDVHFESVPWTRTMSAKAYAALLATYSDHATLPGGQRADLLAAVVSAIDAHGGSITREYATGLFLARAVP